MDMENITINLFEDGTIDIQTYVEIEETKNTNLRDCFEMRPDGIMFDIFPFWN